MKKICTTCGKEKETKEFSKHVGRKDGINNSCKECECKRVKKWSKKNPEKKKEKDKKYYWKTKDKQSKQHKIYYQEHKEEINERAKDYYSENSESVKEKVSVYRQTPMGREVKRNSSAKRRAKCKETDITSDWLFDLKQSTTYCSLCGVELNDITNDDDQYNLDHIVPLCIGGEHLKENVRYICGKCNRTRERTNNQQVSYILNFQTSAYLL